jgi:hypothetical protein
MKPLRDWQKVDLEGVVHANLKENVSLEGNFSKKRLKLFFQTILPVSSNKTRLEARLKKEGMVHTPKSSQRPSSLARSIA